MLNSIKEGVETDCNTLTRFRAKIRFISNFASESEVFLNHHPLIFDSFPPIGICSLHRACYNPLIKNYTEVENIILSAVADKLDPNIASLTCI